MAESEDARMRDFTVMLPTDLLSIIERIAKEKRISRGSVIRMLLVERLKELGALEPQPSPSGPAGPGVSAVKGAGLVGPKSGGDAPQPIGKKQEEGGGRG
jgi:hypothetical protein